MPDARARQLMWGGIGFLVMSGLTALLWPPSTGSLSLGDAWLLGLVEGATEFLPVSSTGHLVVTERLAGIDEGTSAAALDSYTVIIQLGAILAVVGLYRARVRQLANGVFGRDPVGRNLAVAMLIAFVPIGVAGFLLGDQIDAHLLEPFPVAIAWIVGGAVLIALSPRLSQRSSPGTSGVPIERLSIRAAAVIGAAQMVALWPGISRSLVTILAGVLVGLALPAAIEFSFLLGAMTLTAATAFEISRNGGRLVDEWGVWNPILGVVVAAVAAWLSVKALTGFISRHSLKGFGWYRIAIGLSTLAVLATF